MRHKNLAFLLACLGLLTVAVASAPPDSAPLVSAPLVSAPVPADPAPAQQEDVSLSEPDACSPLPTETEDQFAPVAICRLMPECWSNDDCDGICVNGGRCVHSKCPVRICRCN